MRTDERQSITHYLFVIGILLLLILGYYIEKPYISRGTILITLSVCFWLTSVLCFYVRKKINVLILCILLMTGLLTGIEYYSKYSMNYLYHILYFIIVLFAARYIDSNKSMIVSGFVAIASFVKYIQLLSIEMSQGNITSFIFYGISEILLLVMIFTVKAFYQESKKTKALYQELLEAYKQLDEYNREIKILSAKEERVMIARDLHDTLGHDLTGHIMQLELAKFQLENNCIDQGLEYITASIGNARNSLKKVRKIVDTLKNQDKRLFAKQSIHELIEQFQVQTDIHVFIEITDEEQIRPGELLLMFRIIQEFLTNTAKHSKNKYVQIDLDYDEEYIMFRLVDYRIHLPRNLVNIGQVEEDLIPKVKIHEGNGLKGMKERIKEVNGKIVFLYYGGEEKFFIANGYIPREGHQENENQSFNR